MTRNTILSATVAIGSTLFISTGACASVGTDSAVMPVATHVGLAVIDGSGAYEVARKGGERPRYEWRSDKPNDDSNRGWNRTG